MSQKKKKPSQHHKRSPKSSKDNSTKSSSAKGHELLYYGQHICKAIASQRRQDIIRVYCTEEMLPEIKDLLQWCAAQRKAYHVVTDRDLEKISGSVHHEGLAILAFVPPYRDLAALETEIKGKDIPLLYLDGVQNPHNIGTIMRVMASFGWPYLIGSTQLPPLSAAAARMSEGGAEYVKVFAAKDGVTFCKWAKEQGYKIYGSSSHESTSLYEAKLPKRAIFILGHEVHGMSKAVESHVDQRLVIPCTGQVESLNVAVASGILLGEYTRVHALSQGH